ENSKVFLKYVLVLADKLQKETDIFMWVQMAETVKELTILLDKPSEYLQKQVSIFRNRVEALQILDSLGLKNIGLNFVHGQNMSNSLTLDSFLNILKPLVLANL